jgi:hypothetical protein
MYAGIRPVLSPPTPSYGFLSPCCFYGGGGLVKFFYQISITRCGIRRICLFKYFVLKNSDGFGNNALVLSLNRVLLEGYIDRQMMKPPLA